MYLLRLTPAYKGAPVTRSRNSEILSQCDIIVDVEGKYDEEKYFDHHQRGFDHVFSEKFNTKLSSAGLIYKYPHPLHLFPFVFSTDKFDPKTFWEGHHRAAVRLVKRRS